MNTRKRRIREPLIATAEGNSFTGERVVEGTRKVDQYVIYRDLCIADLHGYEPGQRDTVMVTIARQILLELAKGQTVSAQPPDEYGL